MLNKSTVVSLLKAFQDGTTTPLQVVEETLEIIRKKDPTIHAFLDVYGDEALVAAKEATERYARKEQNLPSLLGIPVAIKNNILIDGKRATGGSKILENYIASYDATVIARLKEAGVIIVGSTNLDEFAMGSSTEQSAFCPTKNPLDVTRVPGGSSGGSAAAVAMGAVPVALGTDTGGSVRQPASFCGLVGFKPTYGAVSRYGLMAMGSSFDQAGPLSHTVADTELIHKVISGVDPLDATTIDDTTYKPVLQKEHYTVGIPTKFLGEGVSAEVQEVFESHVQKLKDAGHTIVSIDLPLFEKGLAAYYISIPAEVSSNLARYDGMRYGLSVDEGSLLDVYEKTRSAGFGPEVKRRILLGTYVLSSGYYDAYYAKAEAMRERMREELASVFESVDLILLPSTPTVAFPFGAHSDPVSLYKQDIFTVPVNLTGVPALSIPGGMVQVGDATLPVGVQYIAPHGGDERLFDIGKKMNVADSE